MKTNAELAYWISAAFIVIVMVTFTASVVWSAAGGPGPWPWLDTIGALAEWLFPFVLLLGVLWLVVAYPELSFYIFAAWLVVGVVTTLALPAWLYSSRRATLRTRASVLAGIVVVGVAIKLLFSVLP